MPDRLFPDMADPGREGGRLSGDDAVLVMNGLVLRIRKTAKEAAIFGQKSFYHNPMIKASTYMSPFPLPPIVVSIVMFA
jgi:hypothetical protein